VKIAELIDFYKTLLPVAMIFLVFAISTSIAHSTDVLGIVGSAIVTERLPKRVCSVDAAVQRPEPGLINVLPLISYFTIHMLI